MVKVTVAAGSTRQSSDPFLTEERILNQYAVIAPDGARGRLLLRSVLGYASYSSVGLQTVRAMTAAGGYLYVVASGMLYKVGGGLAELGEVADDPVTTISAREGYVTVAAGGSYWVYNASTGAITNPASGRIADGEVGTVTNIAGREVISGAGDEIEWTAVADPASRNALYFTSAENYTDDLLRVVTIGTNIVAIGSESIEVFGVTGDDGADAFARVPGGVVRRGALGAMLVDVFDPGDGTGDNLFFVGNDRVPYRSNGIAPQPLPGAEVAVSAITAETPTHCFHYKDRGHTFFCIRFAARPAWCFDVQTGLWHERSTGPEHGAWEVIATAPIGADWYAATRFGAVYRLARTNTDILEPLKRTTVFRPFDMAGLQFSVSELELIANVGAADIGRPAQAMLRIKRDGKPWSQEMWRSMGAYGEASTRTVWRGLGSQRVATYEISVTEPADFSVVSDVNMAAA